jgi:hypothetical protein
MGLILVPELVYETVVGKVWEPAGNTLDFSLYLSFLCRTGRREGRNKKWYNLGLFADPQPPSIQHHQHHPVPTTDNWIKIFDK